MISGVEQMPTAALTVEAWFKTTGTSETVFSYAHSGDDNEFIVHTSGGNLFTTINGSAAISTSGGSYNDGTTANMFIDGATSAAATGNPTNAGALTAGGTIVLGQEQDTVGGDAKIPADEIYGRTNVEAFDTRDSLIIALLGMLVVAYSDRHFDVDESAVLKESAEAFGVNGPELVKLKAWAERAAALYGDFTALRTVG